MKFKRAAQDNLELNLTPLIDCLLFLIIFFLLSTTFTKTGKLQIQLPQANAAAPSVSKAIDIAVDTQGHYAVNGEPVTDTSEAALRTALLAKVGSKRDMPLVISADGLAPHQAVVTVMDLAAQLGFHQLGIGTRHAPKPASQP